MISLGADSDILGVILELYVMVCDLHESALPNSTTVSHKGLGEPGTFAMVSKRHSPEAVTAIKDLQRDGTCTLYT